MFCQNCGSKLPDGAKFCAHCGASVGTSFTEEINQNVIMDTVPDNTSTVSAVKKPRKKLIVGSLVAVCLVVFAGVLVSLLGKLSTYSFSEDLFAMSYADFSNKTEDDFMDMAEKEEVLYNIETWNNSFDMFNYTASSMYGNDCVAEIKSTNCGYGSKIVLYVGFDTEKDMKKFKSRISKVLDKALLKGEKKRSFDGYRYNKNTTEYYIVGKEEYDGDIDSAKMISRNFPIGTNMDKSIYKFVLVEYTSEVLREDSNRNLVFGSKDYLPEGAMVSIYYTTMADFAFYMAELNTNISIESEVVQRLKFFDFINGEEFDIKKTSKNSKNDNVKEYCDFVTEYFKCLRNLADSVGLRDFEDVYSIRLGAIYSSLSNLADNMFPELYFIMVHNDYMGLTDEEQRIWVLNETGYDIETGELMLYYNDKRKELRSELNKYGISAEDYVLHGGDEKYEQIKTANDCQAAYQKFLRESYPDYSLEAEFNGRYIFLDEDNKPELLLFNFDEYVGDMWAQTAVLTVDSNNNVAIYGLDGCDMETFHYIPHSGGLLYETMNSAGGRSITEEQALLSNGKFEWKGSVSEYANFNDDSPSVTKEGVIDFDTNAAGVISLSHTNFDDDSDDYFEDIDDALNDIVASLK